MVRGLVILLCCAVGSAKPTSGPSTSSTEATRYRVYLDTDRVGLKQDIIATIKYQRDYVLRRNETVKRDERREFTLAFDGTLEVLAAERGEATKLSVRVDHFKKTEKGETQEILPAGAVVIVESAGKRPKYSLADGSEIDRRKLWYVQSLVSAKREDDPSSQDVYGSTSPHAVGESWPVSLRQMARSYALESVKIDTEHSDGQTRIVGVQQRDGVTYAQVESTVRIQTKVPVAKGWKQTFGEDRIGFAVLAPTHPTATTLDSAGVYETTTKFMRYIGRDETEREVSEDHIVRFRQFRVKRSYPTSGPSPSARG
jgi:hypothetical protein